MVATVEGIGEAGHTAEACSNWVLVWQYPAAQLEVNIFDSPEGPIATCTTFPVRATITNTGEADASEVWATLSVEPEGSVRVSEDDLTGGYAQYVGTIPGHGSEANSVDVEWDLHCKLPCDSTITITASGYDEYGWHFKQACANTGNFVIEGGALVSEELMHGNIFDGVPFAGRGWSYGFFAGDANGLYGPFSLDTDVSWAKWGGGPDFMGHVVGMGFILPNAEFDLGPIVGQICQERGINLEGKDLMFWAVHIEMNEFIDTLGPWSQWCVEGGLLQVINGVITGTYMKWNDQFGEWEDSLLGGTYCTDLASTPGRAIEPRFITPDSVTVKQLPATTDLAVTKDANDYDVTVGNPVTYSITLSNNGDADATNVQVTDLLPAGVNYVSSSPSQGWYDVMSGIWDVGDLDDGDSATLDITVTVNTVGEISNRATITAVDQHDRDASNDSSMVEITGLAPDEVTSWAIDLEDGWNLMSLPIIPSDGQPSPQPERDIADLTAGLDLDTAYWYDPGTESFLSYDGAGGAPDDLLEMYDGLGYWFLMEGSDTLAIAQGWEHVAETDPPSPPPAYEVASGWNMIGFKSTVPKLPEDYLAGIAGKYVIIYGYDAAAQMFFIAGAPGHEYLQPEQGYWIAIKDGESGTIYP